MGKKTKKTIIIIICFLVGVIMILTIQDRCYVKMIDAINVHDNEKVEKLLKYPFFNLNKASGHVPYKWISGLDAENTPLEMACKCGNYEAAELLIDKGADASLVRDGNFSPLYLTMEYTDKDDYKLVKLLVENGADPNGAPDENNDGECSLIKCAGMDCSNYDFNGFTHKDTGQDYDKESACSAKYDEKKAKMIVQIFKYLEKETRTEDISLFEGENPLRIAVGTQNLELIEYFLKEKKCDINLRDKWSRTCIFSLRERSNHIYDHAWKRHTLELLLNNGADVSLKDDEGKTVYDYAVEYGDDYLAKLLEPYSRK